VTLTLQRAMFTAVVALASFWTSPAHAQMVLTSIDALRREVAAGDAITIVQTDGQRVAGRLVRFSEDDLDVRLAQRLPATPPTVTIPIGSVRSVDRPRDPVRNGTLIGAGVGAGIGGALFVNALIIDRNEIDEWAAFYLGAAAVLTGLGGLIGWAVDAGHSKPALRFEAAPARGPTILWRPVFVPGRVAGVAMSISR